MFPISWLIGGGLLLALLTGGAAYIKGHSDGATKANYACEIRVGKMRAAIDEQNKLMENENKAWRARLNKVEEENNAKATQREAEFAEMEARFKSYSSTLGNQRECVIGRDDARRLH
jgi:hypothetical protein